MNVRKPVDYNAMFATLDALMAADLSQMERYCEIGRLISGRHERGAAVAAAEYLCGAYPDASGFSARNLRRMREFYRTYENNPELLAQAMTIGWTQNVVILEAELNLQERAWYIRAARQLGWSKLELQRKIAENARLEIILDSISDIRYIEEIPAPTERVSNEKKPPICRRDICRGLTGYGVNCTDKPDRQKTAAMASTSSRLGWIKPIRSFKRLPVMI